MGGGGGGGGGGGIHPYITYVVLPEHTKMASPLVFEVMTTGIVIAVESLSPPMG